MKVGHRAWHTQDVLEEKPMMERTSDSEENCADDRQNRCRGGLSAGTAIFESLVDPASSAHQGTLVFPRPGPL